QSCIWKPGNPLELEPFMAEPYNELISAITGLVQIVRKLRSPSGCSWDREQTIESLSPFMLEEAYEVADAIEKNDMKLLRAELGDLLLHVIMSAEICEERNEFSLKDVVEGISEKLVRRHPHVFMRQNDLSAGEVEQQWEAIKASEKKDEGFFGSIPSGMPALQTAWRIQQRASEVGFDWPDARGALRKIFEEILEFENSYESSDTEAQNAEFGDVLFSLVNYCRLLGFEPEAVLRTNNRKFIDRFTRMERILKEAGFSLDKADMEMMENAWQRAKLE
ncbi:MAG: nucleoside triphosphate pyrophosphohydrolase, partial [Candidatus Aegiribacteria sp.]|nr:nucleoside triphosphate pyrophosphohydrolase [Candidatus Aegiribacteria sp.]